MRSDFSSMNILYLFFTYIYTALILFARFTVFTIAALEINFGLQAVRRGKNEAVLA